MLVFSSRHYPLFLKEKCLSLAWSSTSRFGWLVSEPQQPICFCHLSTGVSSTCHHD